MTQKPTLNRGFAKAGVANTGAAKSTTVASAGKKEWTHKPNHVGYLKESKAGNQVIVVEQDITLPKGTMIILKNPADEVDSLVRNGFINEEQAEDRKAKIPEWKLAVAQILPPKQS